MVLSRHTKVGMAVSTLILACAQAHADDSAFRFSGFGTFGGVFTDTKDAEFVTPGQPSGATKTVDFGVDSRIGVQGSYQLNQIFSGTVQVLSKYNGKGNYNPNVEWAFVKAQITPSVGVRAGRIGAPFFMISDYRDVNYANLWVRPPLETYGQVPVSNVTGADLIVQHAIGSANVSAQLWGGLSRATLEDQVDVTIRDTVGLNLSAEFDNGLTLRAGHAVGKVSLGSDTLPAGRPYRDRCHHPGRDALWCRGPRHRGRLRHERSPRHFLGCGRKLGCGQLAAQCRVHAPLHRWLCRHHQGLVCLGRLSPGQGDAVRLCVRSADVRCGHQRFGRSGRLVRR